jgi:hypothetical protein
MNVNGILEPSKRKDLGFAWYYAPLSIPILNEWKERRNYLSSRDRNVIKAKKRIESRKIRNLKDEKKSKLREKAAKNELKLLRTKHRDESRASLHAVLTSPTKMELPFSPPSSSNTVIMATQHSTRRKQRRSAKEETFPSPSSMSLSSRSIDTCQPIQKKTSRTSKTARTSRTTKTASRNIRTKANILTTSTTTTTTTSTTTAQISPSSLPKSPILRGRSHSSDDTFVENTSFHLNESDLCGGGKDSPQLYSRRKTYGAKSNIRKVKASKTFSKPTNTSPLRRVTAANKSRMKDNVGRRVTLSSSTSSIPNLPKLDRSTTGTATTATNHYHQLVSSPPCLLTNKELQQKRDEVLARVKLNCTKARHHLLNKKKSILARKQKQQAWVDENLILDKNKIEKRKSKRKEQNELIETHRLFAVTQEKQRVLEIRKEMKKKWLIRQKMKKAEEDEKQKQEEEERYILDTLSLQRQNENQMKYNQWRKSKKTDAMRKKKEGTQKNVMKANREKIYETELRITHDSSKRRRRSDYDEYYLDHGHFDHHHQDNYEITDDFVEEGSAMNNTPSIYTTDRIARKKKKRSARSEQRKRRRHELVTESKLFMQ